MSGWNNWDNISQFLTLLENKPGYAPYIHSLLDLIPRIKTDTDLEGVQPGLAHLTITLTLPGHRRKIHIDGEPPGFYNIYMDHCTENILLGGNFYGERTTVPLDEMLPALRAYVGKLKTESQSSV